MMKKTKVKYLIKTKNDEIKEQEAIFPSFIEANNFASVLKFVNTRLIGIPTLEEYND